MAEHITAKYLSSLARVGQAYGLKELTVGEIRMVFTGAPAAHKGKPEVEDRGDGPIRTRHDPDDIDPEALANDPRFIAFLRHGANPVTG